MAHAESAQDKSSSALVEDAIRGVIDFVKGYFEALGKSIRGPLHAASVRGNGRSYAGPYTFLVVSAAIAMKVSELNYEYRSRDLSFPALLGRMQSMVSHASLGQFLLQAIIVVASAMIAGVVLKSLFGDTVDPAIKHAVPESAAYLYGLQIILALLLPGIASWMSGWMARSGWSRNVMLVVWILVLFLAFIAPVWRLMAELQRMESSRRPIRYIVVAFAVAAIGILGIFGYSLTLFLFSGNGQVGAVVSGFDDLGGFVIIENSSDKSLVLRSLGTLTVVAPGRDELTDNLGSVGFDIEPEGAPVDGPVLIEGNSSKMLKIKFSHGFPAISAGRLIVIDMGITGRSDQGLSLRCRMSEGEGSCFRQEKNY